MEKDNLLDAHCCPEGWGGVGWGEKENLWVLYTISLKVSLHYADQLNAVENKLDHDMGNSKISLSKK